MVETTRPRTIFISYRREDTKAEAGRLYDLLASHFGEARVFMDVDSIPAGRDFVERITSFIGSCDVLIGLIGSKWLTSVDASGGRRIDDPHDFVRLEIETALRQDVAIIPVLVQGAEGPRMDDLPLPLQGLARHQVLKLTHEDFRAQTNRLIGSIEHLPRRERARVAATSVGFRWMRIIFLLDQEHRITIDGTRVRSKKIEVDGTLLYKGFFDFTGEHQFSIQDRNRSVLASLILETSGAGNVSNVILTVAGTIVYDSSSADAQEPPPWREASIVKAAPIGYSMMTILLQLQSAHTIIIDHLIGNWFGRIYVDGALAVRKYDITGESSFAIRDVNRTIPASMAIDMGPLNNIRKVVLTIDGTIVYES